MSYHIKTLETPINVSGIVNVHFFEFPKNFSTHDEKHPFSELVFVSSGMLNISSESYTGILKKNQLLIHKPMERHSLTCGDTDTPTVIVIDFECKSNKLTEFSEKTVNLNEINVKKLAHIVKEGRNVFAPPYNRPYYDMKKKEKQLFGAEQLLKNLLEIFLIGLIREFSLRQIEKEEIESYRTLQDEIISYLDDNYLEKTTIDELAFLFNTNRSTLCKEFKNVTGKTIGEYVLDKKLVLAKKKLSTTEKTFTEIAAECGFESIHYFTRFFKKATGIPPSLYRQNEISRELRKNH